VNVIGPILVAVSTVYITHYYWQRLSELEDFEFPLSFWQWFIRGIALPIIVVGLLSTGILSFFPPLVEQVRILKNINSQVVGYLYFLSVTSLIVATYWNAVTLVCMVGMIVRRIESKTDFVMLASFWSVLLLPITYVMVRFNGWPSLGAATGLWLLPVVGSTWKAAQRPPVILNYSKAEADIKFGRYDQAEIEVIQQLERDATDFEGWMKLAEIYAKHFKDLNSADQTIRDLCSQPEIPSAQVSVALDTLATWHLTLGKNPGAARSALELLARKLPGTHFARMAAMRIQQLPRDHDELIEREQNHRIRLPALREDAPVAASSDNENNRLNAVDQANRCVDILKREPNNIQAREKLAILFAEQLNQPEQGIEQLRQVMDVPSASEGQKAQWLSLIAAWQLNHAHDKTAARETCQRLIREYPQSPQAFAAQRKLNLLEMEERFAPVESNARG
jgi:hypothetical protein